MRYFLSKRVKAIKITTRESLLTILRAFTIFFIFLSSSGAALALEASDRVRTLEAEAASQRDGTLVVRERISVEFSGQERYFERIIPLCRSSAAGLKHCGFRLLKVSRGNKRCYYQIKSGADQAVLRIGEPGKMLSGKETFNIEYLLRRGVDFDKKKFAGLELVLLDGTSPYKIDYLEARLKTPGALPAASINADSHSSTMSAASVPPVHVDRGPGQAMFTAVDLPPFTSLSFNLEVPRDTFDEPGFFQVLGHFTMDWYPVFLLPGLTLFAMLATWFNYGLSQPLDLSRERLGLKDLPHSAIELGAVLRGRGSRRDLALMALDLARRGYIQFFPIDDQASSLAIKRRFAFDSEVNSDGLTLDINDSTLLPIERLFLERLFTAQDGSHALMIDDFESAAPTLLPVWEAFDKHLGDSEIFWGKPGAFSYAATALGISMLVSGLVLTSTFAYQTGGPWGVGLMIAGVVPLAMARLMPVYTMRGLKMRASTLAVLKASGISTDKFSPGFKLPVAWQLKLTGDSGISTIKNPEAIVERLWESMKVL